MNGPTNSEPFLIASRFQVPIDISNQIPKWIQINSPVPSLNDVHFFDRRNRFELNQTTANLFQHFNRNSESGKLLRNLAGHRQPWSFFKAKR